MTLAMRSGVLPPKFDEPQPIWMKRGSSEHTFSRGTVLAEIALAHGFETVLATGRSARAETRIACASAFEHW